MLFELQPNIYLDTFCMLACIIIVIYNYKNVLVNNDPSSGTGYVFLGCFILLFSLLYRPEESDFWHYLNGYELGRSMNVEKMEEFYYRLMEFIPDNYILWRTAIWGPAAIIIVITFKRLHINSGIGTIMFLCFALTNTYYYTRNCLSLSLLYLGMVILGSESIESKIKKYIIFGLLAYVAFFLHKSVPLYIAIVLIATIIPLNRKTLIMMAVMFPVLYGVILVLASNILLLNFWNESTINRAEIYMESEARSSTLFGIISLLIHYAPVFYFLYIAIKDYLYNSKSKTNETNIHYKNFLITTLLLVYVSFLVSGQMSMIQGRFYGSAMAPLTFAACIYFENNWKNRKCVNMINIYLLSFAWNAFETLVLKK